MANYFSQRRPRHVFLNLWTPVAIGAASTALRAEAHTATFLNPCGYGAFIKKRWYTILSMKNCSSKKASGRMGWGGGADPQGPPPGSATGGGKYLMYDHVQESPCWHQGYFYFRCKFKVEENWGGEECLGCHEAIIGEGRRQDKPRSLGVTFFLFVKTLTNL